MKSVFVTGGNSGIGLALCKQLAAEDGCYVFMGSRSVEKGAAALQSIISGIEGKIEVVQCDVSNQDSVKAAAETVKAKLSAPLYGLVNNAGTGLAHGVTAGEQLATNYQGAISMCNAFLPLLDPEAGRIVNVGSGAGPMWLGQQSAETQAYLTGDLTFDQIEKFMKENFKPDDPRFAYGITKCLLSCYTQWLAKQHPKITSSSISPGFIDTKIVAGFGASKPPEEGTVSIRHCLFQKLEGNGWFYGSDAIRSPFWPLRNPGQAPFTGAYPWAP